MMVVHWSPVTVIRGMAMSDFHIIRTPEQLEEIAQKDPSAIILAGEAGVVRTVKALCELRELVYEWGLPAVVIATGSQVREAREALEITQ